MRRNLRNDIVERFFGPFLDGFMEFEYLELSFKLFLLPFLSISREQSTLPGILKDFYDKIRWKMNTVRSFDPFSLLKIHLIPSLSTRNSWIQIWCYSESAREWTNKLACTFLIFGMKGYNFEWLSDYFRSIEPQNCRSVIVRMYSIDSSKICYLNSLQCENVANNPFKKLVRTPQTHWFKFAHVCEIALSLNL